MNLGGKYSYNDAQLDQTRALIDLYGQWIKIRRPGELEEDAEGGVVRNDPTTGRTAQKLYFEYSSPIAHVSRNASFSENVGQGQRVTTNHVLIGLPDADIRQDDEFTVNGYDYIILYIHPDTRYQRKGEILLITSPVGA